MPFIVYNTPFGIAVSYRQDSMNKVVHNTNVCDFDRPTKNLQVPRETAISELENSTLISSVYKVSTSQHEDIGSLPSIDNLLNAFCMTRRSLDIFIAHRVFQKLSVYRNCDTKLVKIYQNPYT